MDYFRITLAIVLVIAASASIAAPVSNDEQSPAELPLAGEVVNSTEAAPYLEITEVPADGEAKIEPSDPESTDELTDVEATVTPTDAVVPELPDFEDDDDVVRHLSIPEDVPDEPVINVANVSEDLPVPHLPMPDDDDDLSDLPPFGPRIVGGTNARLGEFKGSVSVQTRVGGFHFCGGTVIDAYHVVTAAHCLADADLLVRSPDDIQVMGDDLEVSVMPSNPGRQVRLASHIFVHVDYDPDSLVHDIAVIRVSEPFYVTNTFYPVERASETPANDLRCAVAGWGAVKENGYGMNNLQRVNVDIIDREVCTRSDVNGAIVQENMMCAGTMAGGRDACQGDSGGGLICNEQLAGIVSFGYGCARPKLPGVYTDISRYQQFVDDCIVWDNGSQENVPKPTARVEVPIGVGDILVPADNDNGGAALVISVFSMVTAMIALVLLNLDYK